MRMFVAINGWSWVKTPDVDDAERIVMAVASGEANEGEVADWLRTFLASPAETEAS